MRISNHLTSLRVWLGLLCLGCALFNSACAQDEDAANNSSQHHGHRGGSGGGRYGHGEEQEQGGRLDQLNPFGSPSPVPGE
jgi:hypothetical protein